MSEAAVAAAGVSAHRNPKPSVNALAAPLTAALITDAHWLRLGVERIDGGAVVVDAGIAQRGGLEAGRRIAEICMGGMGRVALHGFPGRWPTHVSVLAADPVLSCLGSQYAGWSLAHGDGKGAFRALGSGPGRALAVKEDLFKELDYRDHGDSTCLVLEVDRPPPPEIVDKVARDCGVAAPRITFILTPTQSLAGMVQVVARVLEVALHKVHALGFALDQVVDGTGHAPLPPAGGDFITAMGRTNDAILFGGEVHLHVDAPDADAEELARRLPASASRDYGRPFAEIFKAYKGDFYKIDGSLFSPAEALVTAIETGETFRAGEINLALLDKSFGE